MLKMLSSPRIFYRSSPRPFSLTARILLFVSAAACAVLISPNAFAQDSGVDDIEDLFAKEPETPAATPAPSTSQRESSAPAEPIRDVTDLGKLQPFNDIAVIQKRFLPKSERFEIFLAPTLNMNDAFYWNFGASGKFAYYFRERYGVELSATYLTVANRQVTDDLLKRGVRTSAFVTPRMFYGADFKWSPIYGKMTWANRSITPFDFYFSAGAGITQTNQGTSDPTMHIGTGQIFAFSKNSALRWDFSWNMFMSNGGIENGSNSLYHNLFFSVGWSFFFPEANYR